MENIQEKVTTDTILDFLKRGVELRRVMNPDIWLDAALKLEMLQGDEHLKLEDMRQAVAVMKLAVLKAQEKKNVAAADLEVEASGEYREFRLQDHKCDRIDEFVKIAKINARSAGGY